MANNLTILDLDALAPDPKIIKMGGKEWKISADISVEDVTILLKEYQSLNEDPENPETIKKLLNLVIDLFREHQPDLNEKELGRHLKLRYLPTIVAFIFQSLTNAVEDSDIPKKAEEEAAVPPQ